MPAPTSVSGGENEEIPEENADISVLKKISRKKNWFFLQVKLILDFKFLGPFLFCVHFIDFKIEF